MVDKITETKLKASVLLGAQLLVDNGLGDWKIKINNRRTSLAQTWHFEKIISYSKWFLVVANKEQLEGVTLHEAAHAFLGPGEGHNSKFVRLCTKISPNALYARRSADIRIGRYIATCPECGYGGSCNNLKTKYCSFCFKEGKNIQFEMKENVAKVTVL